MQQIQIIIGTVMGSARRTAEFLEKNWGEKFAFTLNEKPKAEDLLRNPDEILLFCVSNTGAGELPESIRPLHNALVEQALDLQGRQIMLINLGDSAFPCFGQSGQMLEDALLKCGAELISARYLIDAKQHRYPQKAANLWFEEQINRHFPGVTQ